MAKLVDQSVWWTIFEAYWTSVAIRKSSYSTPGNGELPSPAILDVIQWACRGDSNYPCANVCLPTPSPLPTGFMISATGSGWPRCLQWRPHQTQILQIRSELWPARLSRLSLGLMATAGWRSGEHKHIHIDTSTFVHRYTPFTHTRTHTLSQLHPLKGIHGHRYNRAASNDYFQCAIFCRLFSEQIS